ncbi:carbohydrate-binding module family 1 protein [Patellaria atrata CBS 101060]|uniref:Carbohydrate-binding module family 1 protein n=1 Tax=Patellaria atrata CBS 101060 TaxID=1346257 RepID=A0A9P4VJE3_9PEZI|nr:carbohydrate-binding module family 1 protein [Patellaria atrata CBS 101060]
MYSSLVLSVFAIGIGTAEAVHKWSNVKIGGGGGFVPGIVFNEKAKGVAYARTDIGGLYRLNADDSWTPLTDAIAQSASWNRWGIDAVATDPIDPKRVYAAVGMYTNSWDPNNGAIIRSSDSGNTWSSFNLTFKVGGNMPGRGMGERLAVDPNNNKIIYYGARSGHGLWKSIDQGVTFSKVTGFTAVGTYVADPTDNSGYSNDIQGLAFITFDSNSGTVEGATSRIFVGTADKTTSVYVSEDAGATWRAIPDQPTGNLPHKAKLQPAQNVLYLTYSNTTGPYDGGTGSVHRYDITSKTWTDITPVKGGDLYYGFGGLAVDLQKPGTLMVASLNSWYPDAQIFRSTDSGATWSPIWEWAAWPDQNLYYSYSTPKAPWIDNSRQADDTKVLGWMIEALEINPFDSDHWLYGTGLTIYGGHDLTKWDTVHKVTIESLADGIEEEAVQDLASIPSETILLAAVGDVGGFTFKKSLSTVPREGWLTPLLTTNTGVDYAGNNPTSVIRVGNSNEGKPQAAISTDGGVSWSVHPGAQTGQYGGKVALSAGADAVIWSTTSSGVLLSHDSGTFSEVSSLPSGAVIASDKRNATVFYGGSSGTFYISTDSGKTFVKTTALGSAASIRDIAANPTLAGDVWVSTDVGILHSTNYGTSFTQVSKSLTNVHQIALGKGSGSYWNVYAFATGPNGDKLYASGDVGTSWTDIQGGQGFGAIDANPLAASKDTAGLVFVGTNGRGVFQGSGTVLATSVSSAVATLKTSTRLSSVLTARSTKTKVITTPRTIVISSIRTSMESSSGTIPISTSVTGTVRKWDQCGGQGYNGPTECVTGTVCTRQNEWYSQCA